jgi:hypothetical protein
MKKSLLPPRIVQKRDVYYDSVQRKFIETFTAVSIFTEEALGHKKTKELLMQPKHPFFKDLTRRMHILESAQKFGPVIEITENYIKLKEGQVILLTTLTDYERNGAAESSGHPSEKEDEDTDLEIAA